MWIFVNTEACHLYLKELSTFYTVLYMVSKKYQET